MREYIYRHVTKNKFKVIKSKTLKRIYKKQQKQWHRVAFVLATTIRLEGYKVYNSNNSYRQQQ